MSLLSKIFGDSNEKYLKSIALTKEKINSLEPQFQMFSDTELKAKTIEFKKRLAEEQSLDDLLVQSFALVRETAKRMLGQRHFDVQLLGGIILHQGKIAEMKTGEGKTLAATLPVYLNALSGKGVHVITVNDYLAKRDAVWMGQIYYALGLSVGCIAHDTAYVYDPEYEEQGQVNEKEDNERDKKRDVLGGFKIVKSYLRPCSRKEAYSADITYGTNNEFGFDYLRDNMVHNPEQMVQRGFNFAILDEIDSILIDEARTPLIISAPDVDASELYQRFSQIIPQLKKERDYEIDEEKKLATLTEQGIRSVENFLGIDNIYTQEGIDNLHHLEQALRAHIIFKKDIDYVVKDGNVIIVDEFTGRLMPGRRWSGGLHQAVEAKEKVQVNPESRTLATITFQNLFRIYKKIAGMTGTALTSAEEFDKVYGLDVISVPTNMPMIRKDIADKVFKTEKGKLNAIIAEIEERHKKGQPILIGTRSIEKNEYLARLLEVQGIDCKVLNAKHHEQEGQIIAKAGEIDAVTVATNMAGRGVDIVLGGYPPDNDIAKKEWQENQNKVKQLGGLYVIGTERHEARRVDNQLRGRTGRQGDNGSSQFFLSLEDDLLRIFGGEKIKSLMEKLKIPEDQPIEAGLISRAVESAQSKIEGFHFDVRKNLLKYDDVMAKHRDVFYEKRRKILKMSEQDLKQEVILIWTRQGFNENDFTKKEQEIGDKFIQACKFFFLRILDNYWMRHLEDMAWIKDSSRLKAYANIDPFLEYKKQGYRIFQEMITESEAEFTNAILKFKNPGKEPVKTQPTQRISQNRKVEKPERNKPCPCGSGKKYKKCCWPKYG